MSKFSLIQERLTNAFPQFWDCFSIDTRSEIKIIDYDGLHELRKSYLVNEDNTITTKQGKILIDSLAMEKSFKVSNIEKIGFIPIDGQGGLSEKGGCDFVIFDNKDFCFVEIKLNATSLKRRAVGENRAKAIGQLSKTIDLFNEKLNKNYSELKLEAYVSTPKTYPKVRSSRVDVRAEFLEKYEHLGFKLMETDEKICR
jgi:hypothetical protein